MDTTLSNGQSQSHTIPSAQVRLLIVSDLSARLSQLSSLLATGEVEVTAAASIEEMCCGCRGGHDLAVVDVSPEIVSGVLKVLRGCAGCTKIPVLVEASRIATDVRLAGLLPKYRAMPCSRADLITLARQRITPSAVKQKARGIL
jgi:hypothetical protein